VEERFMRRKTLTVSLSIAALFASFGGLVRGSAITPDSIPNPPGMVASTGNTTVPSNNLVSIQYTGLGLNFNYAALTRIDGMKVWAPVDPVAVPAVGIAGSPPPSPPPLSIGYGSWTGGNLVVPGTLKAASVYSLTLKIVGAPVAVNWYNSHGQALGSVTHVGGPLFHGGDLYTWKGGGVSMFSVSVPAQTPTDNNYPAWGVAEVSFVTSPEPSSLVLAALGAAGAALRFGRKHLKQRREERKEREK
jgi:hypothetical protein